MCNVGGSEWQRQIDWNAVCRRAGGRRRYNAMRRRKADARRVAIAEVLDGLGLVALFARRGLSVRLAAALGVHRTTVWRDLQRILSPPECHFVNADGEELFSVTRACQGGPVVSVTDPEGNEIRGAARRQILRLLPRYRRRR